MRHRHAVEEALRELSAFESGWSSRTLPAPVAAIGNERERRGVAGRAQPPDAAWLHVSAGLGASRYAPVRFACRPEASLLTLTAAGDPR